MRFEPLTETEAQSIHDAALQLLEEVGLLLPATTPKPVATRLRDAGLTISGDGRLRLSRAAVGAALKRAPRRVVLGARDARRHATLDGTTTYVTTDGCGSKTLDPRSGRRRPAILADIAASARLADALPGFHVYWMMVSAEDVPLRTRVGREYLTALGNTTKHVQMIDVSRPEEARLLVDMARVVRETGVTTEAPVSMLISVVSPLRLDPGGLEAALTFAAAGLPVVSTSMPIAGVTAPATAPGTVLLAHAESLGFAALIQMLHPGAPVIYCSFPAFGDPRTGITNYRDPRRFWAAAAATRLGQRSGLPCFTSGELASLLARPDMLCFGGLLEVSTVLSFEQMVIDHELMRDWTLSAAPQPITPDTLAFDVIRDVGPGGHFLTQRHTARHIREFVVPRYADAERPVDPGSDAPPVASCQDQARSEALRLIATHEVPPLPSAADAALERLLLAGAPTHATAR